MFEPGLCPDSNLTEQNVVHGLGFAVKRVGAWIDGVGSTGSGVGQMEVLLEHLPQPTDLRHQRKGNPPRIE